MKTVARIILGALLSVLLGFSPVSAEWYASGYVGVAIPDEEDVDVTVGAFGLSASDTLKDVDLDTSAVFGGKVGHFFEGIPYFGLEVEGYHFTPDADAQTVTSNLFPGGVAITKTDIEVTTVAANALYRFQLNKDDTFPKGRLQPYVGVGLGAFIANLETLVVTVKDDDTDIALGFQGLAGLKFFLSEHLAVFAEYKFIQTGDLEFDLSEPGVSASAELDLTGHLIYGGVAYHF